MGYTSLVSWVDTGFGWQTLGSVPTLLPPSKDDICDLPFLYSGVLICEMGPSHLLTALQGGLLKDNALKTPAGLGHGPQADTEFTRAWSASPGAVWLLAGTSLQGLIDLLLTLWELRTLKTGFLYCFCSLVKPSSGRGWGG